jgi:hypothetical protein
LIDHRTNTITNGGESYNIDLWQVWFMTPFGVTSSREEALQRLKELDLDPALNIKPVAVAISSDGFHEVMP